MSKTISPRKVATIASLFLVLSMTLAAVAFAEADDRPTTFDKVPNYNVYPNDLDFGIGIPIKGLLNLISEGHDAFKWRKKSVAVFGPGWTYGGSWANYVKTECSLFANAGIKLNDPIYGPYSVATMQTPLLVARHTKNKQYKFTGTGIFLPKHLQIGDATSNNLLEALSGELQATPLPETTKIFSVVEKGDTKLYYISVKNAEFKSGKPGGGGWLLKMVGDKIEILRADRAPFGVMLQSWADVDGNGFPEIFLFEAIGAKQSDLAALIYEPETKKWHRLAGIAPCQ